MPHASFDFSAFRESYQRDGVVWPIRLFEPREAGELAEHYESFQARARQTRGREIYIKPLFGFDMGRRGRAQPFFARHR